MARIFLLLVVLKLALATPVSHEMIRTIESVPGESPGGPEVEIYLAEGGNGGGEMLVEGPSEYFLNTPKNEYFLTRAAGELLDFSGGSAPSMEERTDIIPLRKSPEFLSSVNEVIKKLEEENPDLFKDYKYETPLKALPSLELTSKEIEKLSESENEINQDRNTNNTNNHKKSSEEAEGTSPAGSLGDLEKELENYRINEVEGEFDRRIKRKDQDHNNNKIHMSMSKPNAGKGIELSFERTSLNSYDNHGKKTPLFSITNDMNSNEEGEVRRLEKELAHMMTDFADQMTSSSSMSSSSGNSVNSIHSEYFMEEIEKIRKTSIPLPAHLFHSMMSTKSPVPQSQSRQNTESIISNIMSKKSKLVDNNSNISKRLFSQLSPSMSSPVVQLTSRETSSSPVQIVTRSSPPAVAIPVPSLIPPHRDFEPSISTSPFSSNYYYTGGVNNGIKPSISADEIPPQILILGNFPASSKSNEFWENFFAKALEQQKMPKEIKISFVPANIFLAGRKKF